MSRTTNERKQSNTGYSHHSHIKEEPAGNGLKSLATATEDNVEAPYLTVAETADETRKYNEKGEKIAPTRFAGFAG